jgi:hypothetical protein
LIRYIKNNTSYRTCKRNLSIETLITARAATEIGQQQHCSTTSGREKLQMGFGDHEAELIYTREKKSWQPKPETRIWTPHQHGDTDSTPIEWTNRIANPLRVTRSKQKISGKN